MTDTVERAEEGAPIASFVIEGDTLTIEGRGEGVQGVLVIKHQYAETMLREIRNQASFAAWLEEHERL